MSQGRIRQAHISSHRTACRRTELPYRRYMADDRRQTSPRYTCRTFRRRPTQHRTEAHCRPQQRQREPHTRVSVYLLSGSRRFLLANCRGDGQTVMVPSLSPFAFFGAVPRQSPSQIPPIRRCRKSAGRISTKKHLVPCVRTYRGDRRSERHRCNKKNGSGKKNGTKQGAGDGRTKTLVPIRTDDGQHICVCQLALNEEQWRPRQRSERLLPDSATS